MASAGYKRPKFKPLTDEEVTRRTEEVREELKEVFEWEKDELKRLNDPNSSYQGKSASKRALKKIERRKDTVNGQIIYWDLRKAGKSHFHAGIEMNEYWAECRKKKEEKE